MLKAGLQQRTKPDLVKEVVELVEPKAGATPDAVVATDAGVTSDAVLASDGVVAAFDSVADVVRASLMVKHVLLLMSYSCYLVGHCGALWRNCRPVP